jgi:hypothetical protein
MGVTYDERLPQHVLPLVAPHKHRGAGVEGQVPGEARQLFGEAKSALTWRHRLRGRIGGPDMAFGQVLDKIHLQK